ncbi:MAG: type II secretion system protein [Verrucomicrobia bacterium]|nr:type II secretion system protein [Verrucomicrobiota bacterium]
MTRKREYIPHRPGFTLLEMSMVIMVLLALMALGFRVTKMSKNAQMGREAAETLRTVYTAQRLYLAENPATAVSSLTGTLLVPYLPTRATSMPTVKSLTGATLSIKVTVFPPVIDNGSGGTYDPSGSSKDALWDVGE